MVERSAAAAAPETGSAQRKCGTSDHQSRRSVPAHAAPTPDKHSDMTSTVIEPHDMMSTVNTE